MKRRGREGSILIVSLWALSVFSVMVSGVAFQAGQQAVLLKRERGDFESRSDFISGLNFFAELTARDPEPGEDSLEDSWAGEVKLPEPWAGRLTLRAQDEESKINVNAASQGLLEQIFRQISEAGEAPMKGKAADFAAAVLKRRADGPMASLEELALLPKIDPEDLHRLVPYLTVFSGITGVNINTADLRVLEALIRSVPGDDYARADLIRALGEYRKKDPGGVRPSCFLSSQLTPELFLQSLKLTASVQQVQLVSQLLPYLTTDSRHWMLEFQSASALQAQAVIEEQALAQKFRVLSWREF